MKVATLFVDPWTVHAFEGCAHGTECAQFSRVCSCGQEYFSPHAQKNRGRGTEARLDRSIGWAMRVVDRRVRECEATHGTA